MLLLTRIINTVAEFYAVSPDSIKGLSRKKEIVRARHIVCYLAKKKNNQSYPIIGQKLHGRNHSTIMSAVRKISREILKNEELKNDVSYLVSFLDKKNINRNSNICVKIYKNNKKEIKLRKICKKKYSKKQLRRIEKIVEKYRFGWTLNDIANEFKITRERVRQIVMEGLKHEIQNNLEKYSMADADSFIKKEKENHLLEKNKRYVKKEKAVIMKEKRWSLNHDHCKRCGTMTVKHRSNGYCEWCYTKTELFRRQQKESLLRNKKKRASKQREYSKEYLKRPEVIEKMKLQEDIRMFSGNREKAIIRDNYKCRECGLTRENSYEKYKEDLFVNRVDKKEGNKLSNLITRCKKCHNKRVMKIMHETLKKQKRSK